MRRHGTDIMAIGAIVAGAAIGATATLAFAGSPFDGDGRAELVCESPLTREYLVDLERNREFRVRYVPGIRTRATWTYSMDRDGEVRRKRCPRRIAVTGFARETPAIDAARQAELAALARQLAEARTRLEVIRALEGRRAKAKDEVETEAAEARAAQVAAKAAEAADAAGAAGAAEAYRLAAEAYRAIAEAARADKGR